MLQTIREYAAERLAEEPFTSAAQQAHAAYYAEFAGTVQARLDGAGRQKALDQLAVEIGKLRSAWRYWIGVGDLLAVLSAAASTPDRVEQKVVLSTSVARGLLAIRGYTEEVDRAYRRALALLTEAGELPRLFPVVRGLASLHLYRAEFDKAVGV